jgi:GNAT superfamily N-acetyltransferase
VQRSGTSPGRRDGTYPVEMSIELREVTDAVREDLRSVRLAPGQDRFVSTVDYSLAEAARYPQGNPWYRAVYADDTVVGFVMISWDVEPDPPEIHGPWFLWKLIIDRDHQHHGFGRDVTLLIADIVRGEGGTELLTSFVDEPGGPKDFYLGLGFVPTGDVDDQGEIVISLPL